MVATVAGLLSGCEFFPSRFRYRMTVEVETPEGLKLGSSVFAASLADQTVNIGAIRKVAKLWGEAVAVDLPGRDTLFALVDSNTPRHVVETFIPSAARDDGLLDGYAKLGEWSMQGKQLELSRDDYPSFIRFWNRADPTTAAFVDPDDMADSFGSGFVLKRVIVEITRDRVTRSIKSRLPWLKENGSSPLDPSPGLANRSASKILTQSAFIRL